jgi:hypothetical protein
MLVNLPECPKFLDEGATPAAKEIGITLANIFYVIFTPINYHVERLRIRHTENLKQYQKDIQKELIKIPEEKLIEPSLNIVGPALDASRFYIEQEDIRKMFAKLIAFSMNIDTYTRVHPAFIEIIKQLLPDEAKIVKAISNKDNCRYIAITGNTKDGSLVTLIKNFSMIGITAACAHPELLESYFDNLERLGLIDDEFVQYPTFPLFEELTKNPKIQEFLSNPEYHGVQILHGIYCFSDFGKHFYDACVGGKD